MKKKFKILLAVMSLLLVAPFICMGSVGVWKDGVYEGEATAINFQGAETSDDGGVWTVYDWSWTGKYRSFPLPLLSATNLAIDTNAEGRTTGASPYYVRTGNSSPDYVCFPGPTSGTQQSQTGSPIEFTFRVPDNWTSGATFKIVCANEPLSDTDGSAEDTPNYIDWDLVIHKLVAGGSETRYDQTPVTLVAGSAHQVVTLTYATSSDIAAGDMVTVRIWRTFGAAGTAQDSTLDLRIFDVAFRYTAEW